MKDLHFIKVKVRVQDATLDLNDPTVQESLLEQVSLRRGGRWSFVPNTNVSSFSLHR